MNLTVTGHFDTVWYNKQKIITVQVWCLIHKHSRFTCKYLDKFSIGGSTITSNDDNLKPTVFKIAHSVGNNTSAVPPFVENWAYRNSRPENMPLTMKVNMWVATYFSRLLYIAIPIRLAL